MSMLALRYNHFMVVWYTLFVLCVVVGDEGVESQGNHVRQHKVQPCRTSRTGGQVGWYRRATQRLRCKIMGCCPMPVIIQPQYLTRGSGRPIKMAFVISETTNTQ
jgi:hypothetical protein